MTTSHLLIGFVSLRIDGWSPEKVGRTRSTGISLAAHPERRGGVGDKQAVAGRRGREHKILRDFWCLAFPVAWVEPRRGTPAAGLSVSVLREKVAFAESSSSC